MGSSQIILAMCCVMLLSREVAEAFDDPDSLDTFIHDFALKNRSRRRTGKLYEVILPANFSGIEASIVSLKSGSLWRRGANFTFFHIPPRVLPWPFVRRIQIVYQNLGNWSSSYFDAYAHNKNHTLVSPVIGLIAYGDADMDYGKIQLNVMNDPILLHFPYYNNMSLPDNASCMGFQTNGTVEFSNVRNRTCIVRGVGHFSLVIPTSIPPPEEKKKKKKKSVVAAWAIGLGLVVGIMGVVLLIGLTCKVLKGKRFGKMERESEKSESLGSVWVGSSRMPCAPTIRTQPVLENNYVP